MLSYFTSDAFSGALSLDCIMETNTMNHDQTAPLEQSDLGPYCLQYRLSKNLSRRESRQQQVITGKRRVKLF